MTPKRSAQNCTKPSAKSLILYAQCLAQNHAQNCTMTSPKCLIFLCSELHKVHALCPPIPPYRERALCAPISLSESDIGLQWTGSDTSAVSEVPAQIVSNNHPLESFF